MMRIAVLLCHLSVGDAPSTTDDFWTWFAMRWAGSRASGHRPSAGSSNRQGRVMLLLFRWGHHVDVPLNDDRRRMLASATAGPTDHHVACCVALSHQPVLVCKLFQKCLHPASPREWCSPQGCDWMRNFSRAVCSHAHLCSCFEGRGMPASMPKYFQSAAGSRSCTAGEIAILDMSTAPVLQASGKGGSRWTRGLDVCAGLVNGRAAMTYDGLPTPGALTQAARHKEARCT